MLQGTVYLWNKLLIFNKLIIFIICTVYCLKHTNQFRFSKYSEISPRLILLFVRHLPAAISARHL